MKRILRCVIVTLSAIVLFGNAMAQADEVNPCAEVSPIVISEDIPGVLTVLNNALTAYDTRYPDNLRGDTFCLNFSFSSGPLSVSARYNVEVKGDYNVRIDGLALRNDSDSDEALLTITNNSTRRLVMSNSTFTNLRNGLLFSGTGPIEMNGPGTAITCNEASPGYGITIKSAGAIIQGADISHCSEGIVVAASNALLGAEDAGHYEAEKNTIHDNGTGIFELQGKTDNIWAFNSLYGNTTGIQSSRVAPTLVLEPESGKALRCTRDESGNIARRELRFSGVSDSGTLVLYLADDRTNQGRELIGTCSVDEIGICTLGSLSLSTPLTSTECGRELIFITALLTGDSSTRNIESAFQLDGRIGTVFAPPVDMPIEIGVTGDSGDTTVIASNEPVDFEPPDGNPTAPPDDSDDDGGTVGAAMEGAGALGGASPGKSCALIVNAGSLDFAPILGISILLMVVGVARAIKQVHDKKVESHALAIIQKKQLRNKAMKSYILRSDAIEDDQPDTR